MNDKTLEMVNVLAMKLGTTAEHLWGVLTKQALINGVTNVVVYGLSVWFLVWSFGLVKRTRLL